MLYNDDCLVVMKNLIEKNTQVDSIVTDPPYHLTNANDENKGFMGKQWDGGNIAFSTETWELAYKLLKPGGHLIAFSASRTYHHMALAIENAGFEIRDQLMWLYSSGFPKGHNISKGLKKNNATIDQIESWEGWNTVLKPAHEPIVLARKPFDETVSQNVLKHGTGGLNVSECSVGDEKRYNPSASSNKIYGQFEGSEKEGRETTGRYPSNVIHDDSEEVNDAFRKYAGFDENPIKFFYGAKASESERKHGLANVDNTHPTVKPQDLMCYLCRLVTPKNGTVFDPFMGSGSTGVAAKTEEFNFIGVELELEYFEIAKKRMELPYVKTKKSKATPIDEKNNFDDLFTF